MKKKCEVDQVDVFIQTPTAPVTALETQAVVLFIMSWKRNEIF